MLPTSNIIGDWDFNYWPAQNKSSILTILDDGYAFTSNGSWYQWEIKSDGHINIYNYGYVLYDGIIDGDNISGVASSKYSGNEWEWHASRHLSPIVSPLNLNDLIIGLWTLRNDIDEVDDNIVEFGENGDFISKNYDVGEWSISDDVLIISTAGGFLLYYAQCVDGIICGKCQNQIGNEWGFWLEHTYIPIQESEKPIGKEKKSFVSPDNKINENNRKADSKQILDYLQENGIQYFYHFTARKNVASIIANGGLFSWKYLLEHGIAIPVNSGGDEWSRQLDLKQKLEDYVRLSFCEDHPMKYHRRNLDLVLLKIDIEVASFAGTLFSDINAASLRHKHGGEIDDLKKVDLRAVKRRYVSSTDDDFQKHQAEVMVKTHVPLKYIININEFN